MLLSEKPRVSLGHLPTPLEYLPRLSKHLGGPDIYVKRDDCTGLATGGNKTRKLEYSMAEALENGAVTIVTAGAVQSNHVRQTAAAACETADFLGVPGVVGRDDVVANCDYVGEGYGIPTAGMNEAVLLLASMEGLLFDPVYSGKALSGMIDLIRTGYFESSANIVFLHTGGSAALFAYSDQLQL